MKQHNCYGQLVKPPFMLIPKFATISSSSSSSSNTFFSIGFDDMDSLYASPEDFKNMKHRDRTRGLHLLEYFVNRCHEIGVIVNFLRMTSLLSSFPLFTSMNWTGCI